MKTWELSEAKDKFKELFQSSLQEPQIVCDHDQPVAAIVDIKLFNELWTIRQRQNRLTIAQLLDELDGITAQEPIDIEIPERQDRTLPLIEDNDGRSM